MTPHERAMALIAAEKEFCESLGRAIEFVSWNEETRVVVWHEIRGDVILPYSKEIPPL